MNIEILDRIFAEEGGVVTEVYLEAVQKLMIALRHSKDVHESFYWEDVGFEFLKTEKTEWGRHFIRYANALDDHKLRQVMPEFKLKTKRVFREPSKMTALLKGWV